MGPRSRGDGTAAAGLNIHTQGLSVGKKGGERERKRSDTTTRTQSAGTDISSLPSSSSSFRERAGPPPSAESRSNLLMLCGRGSHNNSDDDNNNGGDAEQQHRCRFQAIAIATLSLSFGGSPFPLLLWRCFAVFCSPPSQVRISPSSSSRSV